jgi:ATP-binding cassette subfamily B protein
MTPPPRSAIGALYAALWRHAHGAHTTLLSAMALLSASQLVRLSMPWFTAQAINRLQQGQVQHAALWIAALMAVYAAAWALHGPGRILERNVAVRVREDVSDQLYARLANAPLVWHDAHHSGELQHRVHQAGRALCDFTQNQFVYLQSTISFFGPLIALSLLSSFSGIAAITGYVLIFLVILQFDRALMRLARDENAADRRYVSALLDFLGNASTIIGLRLQQATRRLLRQRMSAMSLPLKRSVTLNEGKWCTVDILGLALTWGLVVVYIWQQHQPGQALLLGSVFMIYQYAQQTAAVVSTMASNFQNFARMSTDYSSADPIWALPAPAACAAPAAPAATSSAGRAWTQLLVSGLHWDYRSAPASDVATDGAAPVRGGLHDVQLVLQRGSRVALVGSSGGGKSTLLRVLAGLYQPLQGQLQLDQQRHDWQMLPGMATLIPQESEIFEASVLENLSFGEPADPTELQRALHASAFDEVLDTLGQGLDTPLSERGFNLSGGQRQRLNLARGVLAARDSTLLLLDEPTSALDPLTESKVLQRLGQAFADACIVASIHRLSLLDRFDGIIVMDAGRVIDFGPREQVLLRQPQLRQLALGASDPASPQLPRLD